MRSRFLSALGICTLLVPHSIVALTTAASTSVIRNEVEALTRHPGVLWTESQPLSVARKKLQPRHAALFQDTSDTTELGSLFHQFATCICRTRSIARKEVFETWAAALQIHGHFFSFSNINQVRRVVDVAGGHGLLAWALLLLDDFYSSSTPPLTAFCLDNTMPPSVDPIALEMIQQWPQLEGRLDFVEAWLQQLQPDPSCLMTSVHACAGLSDLLIDKAAQHQTPIALVPCCHSRKTKHLQSLAQGSVYAAKEYQALLDHHDTKLPDLADRLDNLRATVLERADFQVSNAYLPDLFSAKTRVILGIPTTATVGEPPRLQDTVVASKIKTPPGRMPPLAKEAFLSKFSVPCQDTVQARMEVKALAGRDAAVQRREALHRKNHATAPTFHLSLWMGDEKVVDFEKDLEHYIHNTFRTATGRALQCQVSPGGSYIQKSTGRKSMWFRIVYYLEQQPEGDCKALSMDEAKRIHRQLCDGIPDKFPGWECR